MTPERWQRIRRLFDAALEREPQDRSHFLSAACRDDPALAEEVRHLIVRHEQTGSFLSKPFLDIQETLQPSETSGQTFAEGEVLGRRFRLSQIIGKGGMGEVYKAFDLELRETVALKVIRPEIASDPKALNRLKREIQLARRVTHPNVCRVYDLHWQSGRERRQCSFLTMEYVRGQTLAKRLAEDEIPLTEALRIGVEITKALEAIHEHRIVHRDLKPSNIMVSGQADVKVMDFGVAKQFPNIDSGAETPDDLTSKDALVGTVAYMSPELLEGRELDSRSDIFSLGIVLYEMITGVHPFRKGTLIATASSILEANPPPLTQYLEEVPEGLEEILRQMLAKSPGKRPRSAQQVRAQLVQPVDGGSPRAVPKRPVPAIAVLPFTDMSPQRDQDYFCEGLAEELINGLTQLKGVRVASRTSASRLKETNLDIREIGKKLGVATVLEGSLRKADERLRIGVQLVDVTDGYPLWSERYDRHLDDVFRIQEDISRAVIERLRITVVGGEKRPLFPPSPKNVGVYELYLKGRLQWNKRTESGLERSVDFFSRAIEQDPEYGLAHAALAASYATLSIYGSEAPKDLMPKAASAAERALQIEGELSSAFESRGCVRSLYDWNWEGADADFRKAIELDPRNPGAHHWYATSLLMPLGRFQKARAEISLAREIDPFNLAIAASVGLQFYFERRFESAIEEHLKTLGMDRNFGLAHFFLGQAYAEKAIYPEALQALELAVRLTRRSLETLAALAYVRALAGGKTRAMTLLRELTGLSGERYVSPVLLAQIHVGLGQKDQAFELLEQAYRMRSTDLIWLKARPVFDTLRSDSRFSELCGKIGFPS